MPIPAPPRFGSRDRFLEGNLDYRCDKREDRSFLEESDNGGYRVDIPLLISQHPPDFSRIFTFPSLDLGE